MGEGYGIDSRWLEGDEATAMDVHGGDMELHLRQASLLAIERCFSCVFPPIRLESVASKINRSFKVLTLGIQLHFDGWLALSRFFFSCGR